MDKDTEHIVEQLRRRKAALEAIVREKTDELRGITRALNAFERKPPAKPAPPNRKEHHP